MDTCRFNHAPSRSDTNQLLHAQRYIVLLALNLFVRKTWPFERWLLKLPRQRQERHVCKWGGLLSSPHGTATIIMVDGKSQTSRIFLMVHSYRQDSLIVVP